MCNDYEQHIKWALYCDMMQRLAWGQPPAEDEKHLRQADDIKIGDMGPVLRASGNSVELVEMKFALPPKGRGGPVFNMTSDYEKAGERHLRDFSQSRRCVILASAFYEFTGKKYPKAKHRFTDAGSPAFGIAGIWAPGEGEKPDSFAMLTTEPGPDVAPYHDRQIVVLQEKQFPNWIYFDKPPEDMLRPLPAVTLNVATVFAGSDS